MSEAGTFESASAEELITKLSLNSVRDGSVNGTGNYKGVLAVEIN